VPYGAPSYTYYLVSYQEVHSFTSFFNRFPIVGIVPVSLVWKELIPKIEFLLRRHPPPKFVVIQLGSNDLGTVKGWQLAPNILYSIPISK
jgi:hypothetical protein